MEKKLLTLSLDLKDQQLAVLNTMCLLTAISNTGYVFLNNR